MIRTLVVDDEPAALERYSAYVAGHERGFAVVARCSSAREAFTAAGKENPRLILTDIRMPGEDGLSLLTRLRESGWKGIAIVISGHDDFAYAQQAIRLGVFDFLLKPVFPEDMQSLLSRVATALESDEVSGAIQKRQEVEPGCITLGTVSRRILPPSPADREIPEAVRKALVFVEANLDSRFTLDDAARAACVSPSWLGSSFRRIYSCSFMEYARRYRIYAACKILASSDAALKEVADSLAFPDLPTFSKLFRKIVGASPGAFRKDRVNGPEEC